MDALIVSAIILGVVALVFVGFGLSDYQTLMNMIAYEEQARKDGTYQCCPSMAPATVDTVQLRFITGVGFGIGGLVLFLLNRSVEKGGKYSQLPDA